MRPFLAILLLVSVSASHDDFNFYGLIGVDDQVAHGSEVDHVRDDINTDVMRDARLGINLSNAYAERFREQMPDVMAAYEGLVAFASVIVSNPDVVRATGTNQEVSALVGWYKVGVHGSHAAFQFEEYHAMGEGWHRLKEKTHITDADLLRIGTEPNLASGLFMGLLGVMIQRNKIYTGCDDNWLHGAGKYVGRLVAKGAPEDIALRHSFSILKKELEDYWPKIFPVMRDLGNTMVELSLRYACVALVMHLPEATDAQKSDICNARGVSLLESVQALENGLNPLHVQEPEKAQIQSGPLKVLGDHKDGFTSPKTFEALELIVGTQPRETKLAVDFASVLVNCMYALESQAKDDKFLTSAMSWLRDLSYKNGLPTNRTGANTTSSPPDKTLQINSESNMDNKIYARGFTQVLGSRFISGLLLRWSDARSYGSDTRSRAKLGLGYWYSPNRRGYPGGLGDLAVRTLGGRTEGDSYDSLLKMKNFYYDPALGLGQWFGEMCINPAIGGMDCAKFMDIASDIGAMYGLATAFSAGATALTTSISTLGIGALSLTGSTLVGINVLTAVAGSAIAGTGMLAGFAMAGTAMLAEAAAGGLLAAGATAGTAAVVGLGVGFGGMAILGVAAVGGVGYGGFRIYQRFSDSDKDYLDLEDCICSMLTTVERAMDADGHEVRTKVPSAWEVGIGHPMCESRLGACETNFLMEKRMKLDDLKGLSTNPGLQIEEAEQKDALIHAYQEACQAAREAEGKCLTPCDGTDDLQPGHEPGVDGQKIFSELCTRFEKKAREDLTEAHGHLAAHAAEVPYPHDCLK